MAIQFIMIVVDHFVRARVGFQHADNTSPDGAAGDTGEHREGQVNDPGQAGELEAHVHRAKRAHQHLAFAADIEQASLKGKRNRQPGKDVGDGLGQAFGQRYQGYG